MHNYYYIDSCPHVVTTPRPSDIEKVIHGKPLLIINGNSNDNNIVGIRMLFACLNLKEKKQNDLFTVLSDHERESISTKKTVCLIANTNL